MKYCILDQFKICNHCGECDNRCELDPNKICDNCFACLETNDGSDYAKIDIAAVYTSDDYLVDTADTDDCDEGYRSMGRPLRVETLNNLYGKRKY